MKISEILKSIKQIINIAIIVVCAYWVYTHIGLIKEKIQQAKHFIHHSEITVSTPVIDNITDLQQFVTASYLKDTLIFRERVIDWMPDDQFVRSYDMSIEAGFDFENFSQDSIVITQDSSIFLYLPEPKILYSICNPSNKKLFIVRGFSDAEVQEIDQEVRSQVISIAIKQGILEEATKNGITELSRFLSLLGFKKDKIHIEVRQDISAKEADAVTFNIKNISYSRFDDQNEKWNEWSEPDDCSFHVIHTTFDDHIEIKIDADPVQKFWISEEPEESEDPEGTQHIKYRAVDQDNCRCIVVFDFPEDSENRIRVYYSDLAYCLIASD